ncbi:MAG: glycoside hydrolase family 36 protein [Deltaproteobacteria bacterium]|nr:glycoside hydrolase family 36 protein [Deltaproteobacteria bacterium]
MSARGPERLFMGGNQAPMTSPKLRDLKFKRRGLLAGLAALEVPTPTQAAAPKASPSVQTFGDGRFDVRVGPLALQGAYPAIDDVPVHPVRVQTQKSGDATTITYELVGGRLVLNVGADGEVAWVDAVLEGFSTAPHWVFPLAGARVVGADRFFKQGLGFGGPSGVFEIPAATNTHSPNKLFEAAWSYDSFLTTAVVAGTEHTLLAGAVDHKDYLQRCTLYNKSHRRELVEKKPALDDVLFEAGFSTENIPLPKQRLVLPRLHILAAPSLPQALDTWAQRLAQANNIKVKSPPRFHWDSWYEFYEGHDTARLKDTLAGMAKIQPPLPFQSVLIDAGFSPLGDWLQADERVYEGGLQATFNTIRNAGYAPGLWVAPFMVSSLSRLYKDHPEWVVHDLQGKPIVHGKGKPFFYIYATEEERYYLDTTHPGAFAFLRNVFATYRKWGVKAYKMDFMEWGFKDSTLVKRQTPGKTSVQNFVDVVRMIKEEIGADAYFHGCITPFGPMLGYADSMRVGYDVDTDSWTSDGNTVNMFQETIATQYMNNVLWQNDPDVLYVRDGTGSTRLSNDEAVALTLWNGILGGVVSTSDRPHRLAPDRLALLRFVQPGKTFGKARFPLWGKHGKDVNALVAVRDYPALQAHAVLVLNRNEHPVEASIDLASLGVRGQSYVWQWNPGASTALGAGKTLKAKLERHQAALFFVSVKNTAPARSLGLSGEAVPGL